jgi:hypothetical protein
MVGVDETELRVASPPRDTVPPRLVVHLTLRFRQFLLGLADRLVPAPIAVVEHAHAFAVCHLLAAIAELGVADRLSKGPATAQELASLVNADVDTLHRVLRAAAVAGIVRLDRAGRFHSTRLTRPLQDRDRSAARHWCRFIGSPSVQAAWSDLAETVRGAENGFRRVNGTDAFTWFASHPDEGRWFSAGLGGLTRLEAAMIIVSYPFPDHSVVCDIGGGAGVLLGEILLRKPRLQGVLVDSRLIIEQAATNLSSIGLSDRVDLVEGDFFSRIDARADLYLLKWVLHDWDDATCTRILRNVAAAMTGEARLVIIEGDQPRNQPHPRFSMIDVQMLTVTEGGRERSASELEKLLAESGFTVGQVRHTPTDLMLVEAHLPTVTSNTQPPTGTNTSRD